MTLRRGLSSCCFGASSLSGAGLSSCVFLRPLLLHRGAAAQHLQQRRVHSSLCSSSIRGGAANVGGDGSSEGEDLPLPAGVVDALSFWTGRRPPTEKGGGGGGGEGGERGALDVRCRLRPRSPTLSSPPFSSFSRSALEGRGFCSTASHSLSDGAEDDGASQQAPSSPGLTSAGDGIATKCAECGVVSPAATEEKDKPHHRLVCFECRSCGAILPPSYKRGGFNFFEVLGVVPRFDVDLGELENRYRRLQMVLHPDQHARSTEAQRRFAEEHSREVTLAFRCLKEPVSRARHFLGALMGVEALAEDQRVHDAALLAEVMELNEALMEDSTTPEDMSQWKSSFEAKRSDALDLLKAELSGMEQPATTTTEEGRSRGSRAVAALEKVMFYQRALQKIGEWELDKKVRTPSPSTGGGGSSSGGDGRPSSDSRLRR